MGIRFACSSCQSLLNIKQSLAGKRGKCPECGLRFRIPVSDQPYNDPVDLEPTATPDVSSSVGESTNSQNDAATGMDADPLTLHPNACWYVRVEGVGQFGPASSIVMRQWLSESRIAADSFVWCEGWDAWKRAQEVFSGLPGPQQSTVAAAALIQSGKQASAFGLNDNAKLMSQIAKQKKRQLSIVASLTGISIILIGFLAWILIF